MQPLPIARWILVIYMKTKFPRFVSNRLKNEDGYTLTEMLVVIVIMSLIAAVVTPSIFIQLSRAKAKTALMQLQTMSASLALFKEDVGRYPHQDEGLEIMIENKSNIEGWLGPYMKNEKSLQDPWGSNFVLILKQMARLKLFL